MPEEYPVHHEQAPDSQGDQAPEDINQVEDPEAGLSMTMRGENDWQNNLNPDRKAAEDEMVSHLAEVIPVGDQPAETSEAAPLPTQTGVDNIAPMADIPEKTAEEQIEAGKDLIDYQADLTYDIANPENVKYSAEQEKNIEIMDALLENYPHAFTKGSTDDGRKYLLLKKATKTGRVDSKYNINKADLELRDHGDGGIIFSYRGIMEFVDSDKTYTKDAVNSGAYDLAPILDIEDIGNTPRFEERGWISDNASFRLPSKDGTKIAEICKPIFTRYEDARLDVLKGNIMNAEEAHKNDVEKDITTDDILKALL